VDPHTPVIVAARRSPVGTAGHALRDVPVEALVAPVLRAVADDAGSVADDARSVVVPAHVLLGNCMGPGGNLARIAALSAGLPREVPAMTVDLQCGSGLAAVTTACAMVRGGLGQPGTMVLAGGAESASTAPWRFWPPAGDAPARRYTRAPFAPAEAGDPEMGAAADDLARRAGIDRERQDAYAARSHARAWAAQQAGRFDAELVALPQLARDERVRRAPSEQTLGRLRPAFAEGGTVTAGNSCGVNDGAAVVAVVSEETRAVSGLPGLACLDWETSGGDPRLPGLGPVAAVRNVLSRNGLGVEDVDLIEINEAFAAQVLACCDELGIDEERVCPEGGALALGHPWGASGAVLVVRLFSQLVRVDGSRFGVAAIAVGGGQGVALLVERVG
jgi:acetyl-CoA C-acetyltransferase